MEKIRSIIEKRKYYYIVFFITGYLLMLSETGFHNWMYLIPLKGPSFGLAMIAGNAVYYGWVEKENPILGMFRILKWIFASIVLIMIMKIIQIIIQTSFNIDIGPIFGL